jgi:hypothetical protein
MGSRRVGRRVQKGLDDVITITGGRWQGELARRDGLLELDGAHAFKAPE